MGREATGLRDDGEFSKLPSEDSRTTGPISSLNEAWFHTLDRCVIDTPLSDVIFPLMRNCFWRSDPYGSLAGEESWRSANFRYCWLHHGRAAGVTPQALQYALPGYTERRMNRKQLAEALPRVADRDAADNKEA